MKDSYREQALREMKAEGYCEDFIDDWIKIYDATGMDKRSMSDGLWDADDFIDAYEAGDFDACLDMI